MAKITSKGGTIYVDDSGTSACNISPDVTSYTIDFTVNAEDVTGFTEGSQNFTPGMQVNKLTLNVLWNTAATTGAYTVLRGIIGQATSVTVTVTPESGGPAFSGEFMCAGIHVGGEAAGSPISLGSVEFFPMGAVAATFTS
jgi:hypothetical protein